MAEKSVILHIGTHKTGTTAVQDLLDSIRPQLASINTRFYSGIYSPQNHVELHLAAMRPGRMSPYKLMSGIAVDKPYRDAVLAHVGSYLELCPADRIIFSAEGLSYLRFDDEIDWLCSLFGDCKVQVVVYLRNKADFLRSYRNMLIRQNWTSNSHRESFNYVEEDTWLLDYEGLLRVYRKGFGTEAVTVMDYDAEVAKHGGTVGSFLSLLGFDEQQRRQIGEPRVNVSPGD